MFRTREIGSKRNKTPRLVNRWISEYIHKFSIPVRFPAVFFKTGQNVSKQLKLFGGNLGHHELRGVTAWRDDQTPTSIVES
jgi:hypothetical protein